MAYSDSSWNEFFEQLDYESCAEEAARLFPDLVLTPTSKKRSLKIKFGQVIGPLLFCILMFEIHQRNSLNCFAEGLEYPFQFLKELSCADAKKVTFLESNHQGVFVSPQSLRF